MSVSGEYAPGLWRPAVPLPFYGLFHVRCRCGERFWSWRRGKRRSWGTPLEVYQWHYRREHMAVPDLPPPPDVVWAAIVGDARSGWWAGRRLYDDNGVPLSRRQARKRGG